ncbi:hypothetical protein HDV00_002088 [Rhizophlyctis rosea]|nr:hypothetical protein HDV00_002088 [Rhizophlyctis rosea]
MTMDDYRLLADMSSRSACPRCEDKHDKPPKVRCKRCTPCKVCEGSGVTIGIEGCAGCQAKGFIHPADKAVKAHPPHRCEQCVECKDCHGEGVQKIRAKKSQQSQQQSHQPTLINTPITSPSRSSRPTTQNPSTNRSSSVPSQQFMNQQPLISLPSSSHTPSTPTTPSTPYPLQMHPYAAMQMQMQMQQLQLQNGMMPPPPNGMLMMSPMMMPPQGYIPPNGMIPPQGVTHPTYPMYWPPSTATGRPVVHASMMHPHMLGGLMGQGGVVPAASGAGRSEGGKRRGGGTVLDEISKRTMCPRCEGYGWRHDSSGKHDKKKNEKCKLCAGCKACQGSGTVAGKRACSACQTKGFLHASTDRPHDAPQHLRCFFCKDCPSCKGLGIEDAPLQTPTSPPTSPQRTPTSPPLVPRQGALRRGSGYGGSGASSPRSIQSWHSASSFGSGSSGGSGGGGGHSTRQEVPMSPPLNATSASGRQRSSSMGAGVRRQPGHGGGRVGVPSILSGTPSVSTSGSGSGSSGSGEREKSGRRSDVETGGRWRG